MSGKLTMEHYTVKQRVEIVRIYYQNSSSIRQTFRNLRTNFGQHNRPNERTIRRIVEKFEATGSVWDVHPTIRKRTGRSVENITAASTSVETNPRESIRRRAQQLGLSLTTTWRILTKDLGLHAYKIQITRALHYLDHFKRREFAKWALEKLEVDRNFGAKIIFSDEAHFWLNGYVNKQNCRIWGAENPREILEVEMHPLKVTVWCAFWANGVIGPYFFEDEDGRRLNVNKQRYQTMLRDYFWPKLDGIDISNVYFQQDGATCHTSGETIQVVNEMFEGRVISKNGDVNWPPRSCDLTPLDFFLWGFIKGKVYANQPDTIEKLKANIRREIANVPIEMCQNVIKNWNDRMISLKRAKGGHLDDIIFHY